MIPVESSSHQYHAPTRNSIALERAGMDAVRASGPERIVAIVGDVGTGKSHAAARIVAQHAAVFLRLRTVDTARTIAASLCSELCIPPGRTTAESFDLVVRELRARPRLVVLDEFGFVVGARAVHLVRDLHDATEAHFLVIGDDLMPRKLQQHQDKAFYSRVIQWQATIPLNLEDVRKLASVYVSGVMLADDLLDLLRQEAVGNCRAVVMGLRRVMEFARRDGLARVDAKAWRGRHGAASVSTLRAVP